MSEGVTLMWFKAYVPARWRQVLGSTMHCAARNGIGILTGAAIGGFLHVSGWANLGLVSLASRRPITSRMYMTRCSV